MTSDAAPAERDFTPLLDPSVPLPPDTAFFEMRFDGRHLAGRIALTAITALIAAALIPAGFVMLRRASELHWDTQPAGWVLGIGVLAALCAVVWFLSIFAATRLGLRQSRGLPTRRGLFVTPDALVVADEQSTTAIRREQFHKVDGRELTYVQDGLERTVALPSMLNERERADRYDAIVAWAGTAKNARRDVR